MSGLDLGKLIFELACAADSMELACPQISLPPTPDPFARVKVGHAVTRVTRYGLRRLCKITNPIG